MGATWSTKWIFMNFFLNGLFSRIFHLWVDDHHYGVIKSASALQKPTIIRGFVPHIPTLILVKYLLATKTIEKKNRYDKTKEEISKIIAQGFQFLIAFNSESLSLIFSFLKEEHIIWSKSYQTVNTRDRTSNKQATSIRTNRCLHLASAWHTPFSEPLLSRLDWRP